MRMERMKKPTDHRDRFWSAHDRDEYRCPDCGRKESHPDVKHLEVHHKDENPQNDDLDNLVGLCRHCHQVRHGMKPTRSLEDWKANFLMIGKESINHSAL